MAASPIRCHVNSTTGVMNRYIVPPVVPNPIQSDPFPKTKSKYHHHTCIAVNNIVVMNGRTNSLSCGGGGRLEAEVARDPILLADFVANTTDKFTLRLSATITIAESHQEQDSIDIQESMEGDFRL